MSLVNTGTFEGLIRSLDSDPLRRGKQFEKITKWWLQNDPIHSRDIKKVWLWDEWPDRPGRDIGVDLVAEMRDGSLCAIQSKCFDMGRDIPKSELDSFVSAASTRTFKHRWLVASTDGLSANARRMLRDNHVTQILFSYLDSLEGFWPASFDALGGTPTIVKASPRPHQQDAIRDVVEGLSKVSRGQLIMACGTGKTLTALWITEALEPSTTLVLVPSLSLLSQTLSEWAKNANTKWDYLCVCSDETVNKSDDAPISTTDDLPFDVTTKPADIAAFLERRGRKIIFSTYQSSAQVAKAQKTAGKKFDLVICDEAHRLTGKNDADFATALDDTKISAKKRLFMTATPRTYTASVKAKASERGVEITSMDDETVFGKELHKLSFGQAIDKELLTDYRVVIVGVTDPQVQELIDQRELVSVAGTIETDARTLAAHIGLAKATKDYDLKRTISFHGRIKTAQQFAQQHAAIVEWMPDDHKPSGTIWADTITGAMNSSDRRKLLNKLKSDVPGQHALLSNARCLTEGIDVPSLDGVAFIDPRSSQVDIIQAVGRAIRKADSKTLGTIVLPVLIPHEADAEHALEDTAFKSIWAILNALRSHDDNLETELDLYRVALGKSGSINLDNQKIVRDLPLDIDQLFPHFSELMNLKIVESCTDAWSWWYGLLLKYVEVNGTSRIQSHDQFDSFRLGAWIAAQRTAYRGIHNWGKLTRDRADLLAALPDWTWDPIEDQWMKLFEATRNTSIENSGAPISSGYVDKDGLKVGTWIVSQRVAYLSDQLDDGKRSLLESLPNWSWDPIEDRWLSMYEATRVASINANGLPIRFHYVNEDGLRIGSWIIQQRRNKMKGKLGVEKAKMLEELPGWTWDPRDENWELGYLLLRQFVDLHGSANPNKDYEIDGFKLGSWLGRQRSQHKKGLLSDDQKSRLEELGVIWELNAGHGQFIEQFIEHLKIWIEDGGDPNPKQKRGTPGAVMADGYRITQQAQQARRAIRGSVKNAHVTDEQRSILRAMGFKEQINGTVMLSELDEIVNCIDFNGSNSKKAFEALPLDQTLPNSREIVDCVCPKCGHTWTTVIRYLASAKVPCPECRESSKLTKPSASPLSQHENWVFIEPFWDSKLNFQSEIQADLISEASERKASLICPDCNYTFERQISVLRKSFGCPKCAKSGIRFRLQVAHAISTLSSQGMSDAQIGKRFAASPAVIRKVIDEQTKSKDL